MFLLQERKNALVQTSWYDATYAPKNQNGVSKATARSSIIPRIVSPAPFGSGNRYSHRPA